MSIIRAGVCVLIAFSVLAFGAVQLWSQAILEIGTTILLLLWTFHAFRKNEIDIRWNWVYLPLLGFWGLILIQYGFGLSLSSYLTKIELFKWTFYLLLCFLAVQAFRTSEHRRNFAWFLLSFCFLISFLALVQHFTSNGKLYWVVALPPGSGPFGPFVNRDHFAGFVELAEPMGLALLLSGSARSEKTPLLTLFAILPVAALVISGSRGGIISFLAQMLLLVWILRKEVIGSRRLAAIVGLGMITLALVFWLGIGSVAQRFSKLASEEISKDSRMLIYKDTWHIFRDYPWVGTGAGTLQIIYPHYETHYDVRLVDHAHNDYLEFLSETGLIGALFGLGFISILFWKSAANLRAARSSLPSATRGSLRTAAQNAMTRSLYAGGLVTCVGLLAHGLIDFNLQIPSNAALFILLAGLTTSETDHRAGITGREHT